MQRYIDPPLLLDGLKFDLRLYVLVLSVQPLTAYLFKQGMARFATNKYKRPTDANLHDVYMHLTNYMRRVSKEELPPPRVSKDE